MTDELTALELSELAQCEAVIAQGLRTFVDVGAALLKIRDDRLYKEEWTTFEAYCRDRWECQQHARISADLKQSELVTANLSTMVYILPATESQARPLTALEPEQQAYRMAARRRNRAGWQDHRRACASRSGRHAHSACARTGNPGTIMPLLWVGLYRRCAGTWCHTLSSL